MLTKDALFSSGRMITASMASIPDRIETLKLAVDSLLPQVDKLNIYLNNWDSIPDFLLQDKINAVLSQEHLGDLGAKGKFYWCEEVKGIHLTVDDDIIYPPDYVEKIKEGLKKYPDCIVGFHGSRFREGNDFYRRRTLHANTTFYDDNTVEFIGTGVSAYNTDRVKIYFDDLKSHHWADGWIGIVARKKRDKLDCFSA